MEFMSTIQCGSVLAHPCREMALCQAQNGIVVGLKIVIQEKQKKGHTSCENVTCEVTSMAKVDLRG